jgi:hypothetical protein
VTAWEYLVLQAFFFVELELGLKYNEVVERMIQERSEL